MLYIWNFSRVFMNLSLLSIFEIVVVFYIGPYACWVSKMWCAYLDFLFALMAWTCFFFCSYFTSGFACICFEAVFVVLLYVIFLLLIHNHLPSNQLLFFHTWNGNFLVFVIYIFYNLRNKILNVSCTMTNILMRCGYFGLNSVLNKLYCI